MRAPLENPRASYATPGFRIGTTRAPRTVGMATHFRRSSAGFDAAVDSAARGCKGSVTYSAVPSRIIAPASLERWAEIEGLAIRLRTQRVSGDPPKQSVPSTHTPSTGRACGRAFGPTVVIQ